MFSPSYNAKKLTFLKFSITRVTNAKYEIFVKFYLTENQMVFSGFMLVIKKYLQKTLILLI